MIITNCRFLRRFVLRMINKTGTISLIIIFLLSTVGITINEHFCGGILTEEAVFIEASCACGNSEMPSNCCKNENEYHQLDEDYTVVESDINLKATFITAFISNAISIYAADVYEVSEYLSFKPPLIEQDITVLVQSFLI